MDNSSIGIIIIWIISFALFAIIAPSACVREDTAKEALLDAGYHPIEVGGYGWFECSGSDWFATEFKAYSQDSTRLVEGCVCEGIFKGKTIRLD